MRLLIYGRGKPYITEDERKLNEVDLMEITKHLQPLQFEKHLNFLVTRIVPDRFEFFTNANRIPLQLKPTGRILAGRVLFSAHVLK